jgi:hypothetical protein
LNGNKWEGKFEKGVAYGMGKYTMTNGHTDERKFEDNCCIF